MFQRRYSWKEAVKAGGVDRLDMWPGDMLVTPFGHWAMTTTGHMVFSPGALRTFRGSKGAD